MNLQQLNKLTPEQKTRYMKLERLFGSDGWPLVIEYARLRADDSQVRELNAGSWEENRVWHGARLAFAEILALEDATEKEFEALAAQQAELETLQDEFEHE